MKSIALGTLAGGLTLFVWSAVSWMALPWHTAGFHSFSNEDALTRAIATGAREAGIYTIPGGLEGGSGEQQKATAEKIAKGPFLFAAVRPGAMGSITAMYVRQMLIQLVTAFVLSLLLLRAAPWVSPGECGS